MPECININRRITACRTPEACPASSPLRDCFWHGTECNETLSHAVCMAGYTAEIHTSLHKLAGLPRCYD